MSSFAGGFLGGLGGGAIGRAAVELVLETAQYQEQLAKTQEETKASTAAMSEAAGGFSGIATAAFAAAGIAAAEFGKASVEAAIALNDAQEKLANSIKNSTSVTAQSQGAFEKQAQSISDLTGVYNDQIIAGQSLLVQMGLTADQVTQLTPLVVDLAAKNGVDLNAAFKAVGKAAEGSTGALARYVGPVEKGKNATQTFANVTDKLGANLGFAAKQANAEPWKLLGNQIHDLEEAVGQALVPSLRRTIPILTDIVKGLGYVADKVNEVTGAVESLPGPTETVAAQVKAFADEFVGGAAGAKEFTNQVRALIQEYADGTITLTDFQGSVASTADAFLGPGGLRDSLYTGLSAADLFATSIQKAQRDVAKTQNVVHRFAGDSAADLKSFKDSSKTSMDFVASTFDELAGKAHISADKIEKAFDNALANQAHFRDNSVNFLQDVANRFPTLSKAAQQMVQDLAQKGPEGAALIKALADDNATQQRRILRDWRASQQAAKDYFDFLDEHKDTTIRVHVEQDFPSGRGPSRGDIARQHTVRNS